LKWDQLKWDQLKWDQLKWDQLKWDQLKWDQLKWDQLKWDQLKWDQLKGDQLKWDQLKGDQLKGDQAEGDQLEKDLAKGDRAERDLAEFIAKHYSGRVAEVGVGHRPHLARMLLDLGLDPILTDREERLLDGMRVEKDDIFDPRWEIYQGAALIYSIRPPLEMQLAIGELAAALGADIILRPLQDEVADLPSFKRRLVNSGRASFYLFRMKD